MYIPASTWIVTVPVAVHSIPPWDLHKNAFEYIRQSMANNAMDKTQGRLSMHVIPYLLFVRNNNILLSKSCYIMQVSSKYDYHTVAVTPSCDKANDMVSRWSALIYMSTNQSPAWKGNMYAYVQGVKCKCKCNNGVADLTSGVVNVGM